MIFLLQILFFRVPNGPRVWRTHRIGWPTWQTDTRVLTTFATLQGKKKHIGKYLQRTKLNPLTETCTFPISRNIKFRYLCFPFMRSGDYNPAIQADKCYCNYPAVLQKSAALPSKCTVISENNIKHPYVCLWTELMWQIFIHIWIYNCSADCRNAE